jgi:hypothetical protein
MVATCRFSHLNPEAMWVYDVHTLKILDVNQAALQRYGYIRAMSS